MKKIIIFITAIVTLTVAINAHATLTFYYEEDGNACNRYVEQWDTETEQSDLTDRIDFMSSTSATHHSDLISVTAQVAFIPDHDLVNATVSMRVVMYGESLNNPVYDVNEEHLVTKTNVNAQAGEMVVFTLGRGCLYNLCPGGAPEPGTGNHIHALTFWTEIITEHSGQDQVILIGINETTSSYNVGNCDEH